jgi:SPOR domain
LRHLRPVELTAEDAPMVRLRAGSGGQPAGENGATADQVAGQSAMSAVDRLVDELTSGVTPLQDAPAAPPEIIAASARIVQPAALAPVDPQPAASAPAAARPSGGMARSLRPQLRPVRAGQANNEVARPVLASAPDASLDVDPDNLPKGTRLAQLGAYDSPEVARAEWDRLNNRFEAYLAGKSRVIQQASSGGRTFYRLRAMGFDDISDARQFCSALQAENADCIPVTTR